MLLRSGNRLIFLLIATDSEGGCSVTITIKCSDTGYADTHEISGESFSEVLINVQKHAIEEHGLPEKVVHSTEQIEVWKGAIRQASRPSQTRTRRSVD